MKKSRKILLIIVSIIVILAIAGKAFFANTAKNLDALKDIPMEEVDLSLIPDGTYDGNYQSFPIEVCVEVTVEDHKITDIRITKHDNGQGAAAEAITEDVIAQQSLQVDTVSGATYSSMVILLAIENALNNAVN